MRTENSMIAGRFFGNGFGLWSNFTYAEKCLSRTAFEMDTDCVLKDDFDADRIERSRLSLTEMLANVVRRLFG